jgi:hypothetical protein
MASHESGSVPIAVTDTQPEPRITADDRAERMVAFVVRLDATLRDLVREGKALGIDRSIWVDRAMRAWDGVGG